MTTLAILHALGSSSLFATRMFQPALLTALLLRFGPAIPWFGDLGLLSATGGHPVWFTHTACILTLLALSIAEEVADRVPELRDLLQLVEQYVKPAAAALTALGVVHATDAAFVSSTLREAGLTDAALPLLAASGTAVATWLRAGSLQWLQHGKDEACFSRNDILAWVEWEQRDWFPSSCNSPTA